MKKSRRIMLTVNEVMFNEISDEADEHGISKSEVIRRRIIKLKAIERKK